MTELIFVAMIGAIMFMPDSWVKVGGLVVIVVGFAGMFLSERAKWRKRQ